MCDPSPIKSFTLVYVLKCVRLNVTRKWKRCLKYGGSVTKRHFRLQNVFIDSAGCAPLVEMFFSRCTVFIASLGFSKAGAFEGRNRRQLGGNPDGRMDDWIVSVILTSTANGLAASCLSVLKPGRQSLFWPQINRPVPPPLVVSVVLI